MRILVTGASGFIGRAMVAGLLQNGEHEVVGLSRTLPRKWLVPGAISLCADLTEEVVLDGDVDYILHCAAIQDFPRFSARENLAANLLMTENIAKYGRKVGVKGVIFTSSISLHGKITSDVVDEGTPINNPTWYGISKHLCELILREYQESFPVVALRLCGVVGPGAEKVWLSRVLSAALRGEAIHIFNADRPFNNVLHTDGLLSFIRALIDSGFSGFNAFPVASRSPMPIRSVVEEIVSLTSSAAEIIDDGKKADSFMISNDYAIDRFRYNPTEVAANLKKYALGAFQRLTG